MPTSRLIAFVLFDDALTLNVAGPAEVFTSANRLSGETRSIYTLIYVSTAGGMIRTSSGVSVLTQSITSVVLRELDTIMVVGGVNVAEAIHDTRLIEWIGRASATVRRTCSVCTGAFLLAAADLLNGRRAVTHWASVDDLRAQYPLVLVEKEPIYVNDGNIWTSAGITAGIDLALTLVEADHRRSLSLAIAKELVVFLHRPGGQSQFSRILATQERVNRRGDKARLEDVHGWIFDHLDNDLCVERLAERVKLTPRTFARRFVQVYGRTPAKFVEDLRLEAACRHLEEEGVTIKQIAQLCGFGDEERMRRTFLRRLGLSPVIYRERPFCG